jgi:hypothetical protein
MISVQSGFQKKIKRSCIQIEISKRMYRVICSKIVQIVKTLPVAGGQLNRPPLIPIVSALIEETTHAKRKIDLTAWL